MLAVLAAVAFFLALVHVDHLGPISMITLGLLLLALHLAFPIGIPYPRRTP